MLDYPLSSRDKKIIKDLVKQEVGGALLDILIQDFFYYTLIFGTIGAGGDILYSSDEDGYNIAVQPVQNDEAEVRKTMASASDAFSFLSPSRFRVDVDPVYGDLSATTFANSTAYLLHGDRDDNIGYYGFKISGAEITGVAKIKGAGSEQATANLQTFVNDAAVDLMAVYYPSAGKVDFWIDNTVKGTLKCGILGDVHANLFNFYLKKTNAGISIKSSTNASPINIETTAAHGFATGDYVTISDHATNTAANNTNSSQAWVITVVDATNFTLTGSTGNGIGGQTGTVDYLRGLTVSWMDVINPFIKSFA